ncbi:MAG: hypothetical protein MZV63_58285 [Marinilabiliales bacterium]|nr:hypothetical protein [Marinilabiliales bacterium]
MITLTFPILADALKPQYIFGIFCGMMVLPAGLGDFLRTETKGYPSKRWRLKSAMPVEIKIPLSNDDENTIICSFFVT